MDAPTLAEQQRICRDLQMQAWQDVPYIPTGAWMQPFAFRKSITGMLNGFPLFHNIRKG
jgi:peptide/nickel transport system substrate-binding protein